MKLLCSSDSVLFRQLLANQIYGLLMANGSNVRWVYDGLKAQDIPKGGLKALLSNRPFDGVRAEVVGATLTVEITAEWSGEREEADGLRFGCYDYETFRNWFFSRLRRAGIQPRTPAPVPTAKPVWSIKADLRKSPILHAKAKNHKR